MLQCGLASRLWCDDDIFAVGLISQCAQGDNCCDEDGFHVVCDVHDVFLGLFVCFDGVTLSLLLFDFEPLAMNCAKSGVFCKNTGMALQETWKRCGFVR